MVITTVNGNARAEKGNEEKQIQQTRQEVSEEMEIKSVTPYENKTWEKGTEERKYELPEEYATRGDFPEQMQTYTREICKNYDVSYALIIAMIEHESGYMQDAIGDSGRSKGYMQIYEKYHADRMEKLGCDDILNPYQNILVGVDYIAELIDKYGTEQDALAAYNYGEKGARENLWNNGVYVYEYNETILKRKREIEEVVGK